MKFLTLTLTVFVTAAALLGARPAHAVYKCVDEKGITHYGDTMPPQCAKKEIKEMTKQGSLVRTYDAPFTPEQLKAQRDDADRRKDENKRIADQKLRDMALLATYGSEREFDVARDKDLAVVEARKKSLTSRNEDVDKQLKKMDNEMEFYVAGKGKSGKGKEAPAQLVADHKSAKFARASLDAELAKSVDDKATIIAKYDTEKTRWKKLKSGMLPGTLVDDKGEAIAKPAMPTQIVGQSTLLPGQPRGIAECGDKTYECSLGLSYLCRAPNVGGQGVNSKMVRCKEVR